MVSQQNLKSPQFTNQTNNINGVLMDLLRQKQMRESQGGFNLGNMLSGAGSGAVQGGMTGGLKGAVIGGVLGAGKSMLGSEERENQGLTNALMQINQTQENSLESLEEEEELEDEGLFNAFKRSIGRNR